MGDVLVRVGDDAVHAVDDHLVARAHGGDQFGLFLRLLLLRADEQEVEDDRHEQERRHGLEQRVGLRTGGGRGGLCEGQRVETGGGQERKNGHGFGQMERHGGSSMPGNLPRVQPFLAAGG